MASKNIQKAREFISRAEKITPKTERQQFRRSECLKHAILAIQHELKGTTK